MTIHEKLDSLLENSGGASGGSKTVIDLGIGQSFSVSFYTGYENFSIDDFICELEVKDARTDASVASGSGNGGSYSIDNLVKSYSNGILTAYHQNYVWVGQSNYGSGNGTKKFDVHAYLIL